jgi:hypothetical protein
MGCRSVFLRDDEMTASVEDILSALGVLSRDLMLCPGWWKEAP